MIEGNKHGKEKRIELGMEGPRMPGSIGSKIQKRMIRVDHIDKIAFEQRYERSEGISHAEHSK